MKVQTAVLLLCFLSVVFLSVVQAKPSPALMRELVALEKYLEKKEGLEGTDGQNVNRGEKPTDEDLSQNSGQETENKPTENEKDKPKNENNNNGETNTAEGLGPEEGDTKIPSGQEEGVPPAKPEEGVTPDNAEGSGPSDNGAQAPNEDEGFPASGGKMEVDLSPEVNPSEGQVKNERDQIYKVLDEITGNIKDALDKLSQLGEAFRAQFQNDDRKFAELENNSKAEKEKTKEKIGQIKTILEEIKRSTVGLDETPSVGKESVRENAPARRSHISDTEFVNMLHSLLTYS